MKNLGEISKKQLKSVGIKSHEELKRVGALEAFKMLEDRGYHPTRNMLYALIGEIENMDWRDVAAEMKSEAKDDESEDLE